MSEVLITDLPTVEQKPIIEYSKLENIGELVKAKIDSIGIDSIEATEENLSVLKSTRAALNNQFKDFEDRRKFIKDNVLKPYDDFEAKYKSFITINFKNADDQLKSKITTVETGILNTKINGLKAYFAENNPFDFLKFDQLGLKITRSASDKSIKDQIDASINQVEIDIETINTLQHKERVLAQYQMNLDLNASISSVNIAIERERQIEEARKSREAAQQEAPNPQQKIEEPKVAEPAEVAEVTEDNDLYKTSFKIIATKQQIRDLKAFMEEKGIKYE